MHLQKKAGDDDDMGVDEKPKRGRGAAKKDAPAKAKAAPKKAPKKKKDDDESGEDFGDELAAVDEEEVDEEDEEPEEDTKKRKVCVSSKQVKLVLRCLCIARTRIEGRGLVQAAVKAC